ncbi:MICOS complex subunit Mic60 [Eumeta japonica]|uniref:MICOS complex subunit MIC60 n=1 Tax=Eumeta variegata TaxID=151549 RepID=A0A4C2AEQ2_EUMVA|nr:MICOS complex subunit Mic60 [Eumeta japonica]
MYRLALREPCKSAVQIPIATSKSVEAKPENKVETPKPKPNRLNHCLQMLLNLNTLLNAAALAVKEYNKAIEILKNFNNDVRRIVDAAIENVDTSLWTTLRNKTNARDSSVATAEKLAREAMEKIVALANAAKADNHDQVIAVRNKIKQLVDHINNVKDELYKIKYDASISEKYWKNVEKARNYFVDEIESIFPGINLAEQKLKVSQDDLDLFITHAYSHVLALQRNWNDCKPMANYV